MDWSLQCAVVIPCYNEFKTIGPLVAQLRSDLPAVFVIDDGSSDATACCAGEAGATVISHQRRYGKGAALQTGWRTARERGFAWALTLDGDGQHAPADIPRFFQKAEQTGAQLIVGNRMEYAVSMPLSRRWVNRWMSRRLSHLAGQWLPDTQCGFRLMRLQAWSTLQLRTTNFEVESELLIAFARAGYQIDFVAIQVIYCSEKSKICPLRDGMRWWRWWRHAARNLRGH